MSLAGSNVLVSIKDGSGSGGIHLKSASLTTLGSASGFPARQTVYNGTRYAYSIEGVNSGSDVLRIIDLQDPTQPQVQNPTFNLVDPGATAIAYHNNRFFVSQSNTSTYPQIHKLKIFDVTSPTTPSPIASLNLAGAVRQITIDGDFIYLAQSGTGVAIVHIGDVSNPFPYGTMKVSYEANAAFVTGNHVFVADGYDGLTIHSKVTPP